MHPHAGAQPPLGRDRREIGPGRVSQVLARDLLVIGVVGEKAKQHDQDDQCDFRDDEEGRRWQGQIENIIFSLVSEIRNPAVGFSPTTDFIKQCPGCPYMVMCGTQWTGKGEW